MQILAQLMMGLGLAACAGLRAWLPMLVVGVLARADYVHLNPSFAFLARNDVLIVLAVATVLEILGDKIIAVDHFLDAVGTVVRPVAGTILASSLLTDMDPLVALVLGLIMGGTTSLAVHAGKSLVRVKCTATAPLHGGVGNAVVSTAEDVTTGLGLWISAVSPLVAVLLAALAIALSVWLAMAFVRSGAKLFGFLADRREG